MEVFIFTLPLDDTLFALKSIPGCDAVTPFLNRGRFQRNIGLLDREILNHVKEKLADLLELSSNHHPAEAGIEGDTLKTDIVYLEPSTNARVENLEKQ